MAGDVERWRREGNRKATIEKTQYEMQDLRMGINKLWNEHTARQNSVA